MAERPPGRLAERPSEELPEQLPEQIPEQIPDSLPEQSPGQGIDVGAAASIAPGKFLTAKVDGLSYIIARVEDRYYAVEDKCSHEDYPLSYGCIKGPYIKCSLHGSWFSLETGAPQEAPADEPIATFRVEVRDGRLLLDPAGAG